MRSSSTGRLARALGLLLLLAVFAGACELDWEDDYQEETQELYYNVTIDSGCYDCQVADGEYACSCAISGADHHNATVTAADSSRMIEGNEFNLTYGVHFTPLTTPSSIALFWSVHNIDDFPQTDQGNFTFSVRHVRDDGYPETAKERMTVQCGGIVVHDLHGFGDDVSSVINGSINILKKREESRIHAWFRMNSSDAYHYLGNCTVDDDDDYYPVLAVKDKTNAYSNIYAAMTLLNSSSIQEIRAIYRVMDYGEIGIEDAEIRVTGMGHGSTYYTPVCTTTSDGYCRLENGSIMTAIYRPVCATDDPNFVYVTNQVTFNDLEAEPFVHEVSYLDTSSYINYVTYYYDYYGASCNSTHEACFKAYDQFISPAYPLDVYMRGFETLFTCRTNTSGECCIRVPDGVYSISSRMPPEFSEKYHELSYSVFNDFTYSLYTEQTIQQKNITGRVVYYNGTGVPAATLEYWYCRLRTGDYYDYWKLNQEKCELLDAGSTNATGYYPGRVRNINGEVLVVARKTGFLTSSSTVLLGNSDYAASVTVTLRETATSRDYELRFIDDISRQPIPSGVRYTIYNETSKVIASGATTTDACFTVTVGQPSLHATIEANHVNYTYADSRPKYLSAYSCTDVLMSLKSGTYVPEAYKFNVSGYLVDNASNVLSDIEVVLECPDVNTGGNKLYKTTVSSAGGYNFTGIPNGFNCNIHPYTGAYSYTTRWLVVTRDYVNVNFTLIAKDKPTVDVKFIVYELADSGKIYLKNADVYIGSKAGTTDEYGETEFKALYGDTTYTYEVKLAGYHNVKKTFTTTQTRQTVNVEMLSEYDRDCNVNGHVYFVNGTYDSQNPYNRVIIDNSNKVSLKLYRDGILIEQPSFYSTTGYYSIDVECGQNLRLDGVYNDYPGDPITFSEEFTVADGELSLDIIFKRSSDQAKDIVDSMWDMVYDLDSLFPLIAILLVLGVLKKTTDIFK